MFLGCLNFFLRGLVTVLQVSSRIDGKLLDDISGDITDTVDHASLSKLFLLTLITGSEDAKGDNFIVDGAGHLVGIDNDLGFVPPYSKLKGDGHDGGLTVNWKNLLFASADVLGLGIHPSLRAALAATEPGHAIAQWICQLQRFEVEVTRLLSQGALPAELAAREAVGSLEFCAGSVRRMTRIWHSLAQKVAGVDEGVEVTHGDLLRWSVPETAA